MTVKPLDGNTVLCEDPGCGKPAVYLFSQTHPMTVCVVYCQAHGLPFAERLRVALPKTYPVNGRAAGALA